MKRNPAQILTIIGVVFFGLFSHIQKIHAAPSLQFTPSTKTASQNSTFTIDVSINTDGQSVIGANAVIAYPTADVQVISVTKGSFFPDMSAPADNGRIEVNAYISTPNESKSGSGTIATIQFKALKATGTSSVGFVCTDSSTDTQIFNPSVVNILSCSNVNSLTVSYISTSAPTPTPTQPGSTPNPSPTPTPGSGGGGTPTNKRPNCVGISALPAQNGKTYTDITLSCAGRDDDGSIYAAEFFFGDGTSKKVSQIIGSSGTIMVKHQYKTAGKYATACRVIDNDNGASDVPSICTLSYTVEKGSTQTVTKKTGTGSFVAPTLEPTIPVVTLEPYQSPTPLAVDLGDTNFETQEPTEEPSSSMPWQWIAVLGGIGLLILIILILIIRSFKKRNTPPPSIPINTGYDPNQPMQQYPQIQEIEQQQTAPPQPPTLG